MTPDALPPAALGAPDSFYNSFAFAKLQNAFLVQGAFLGRAGPGGGGPGQAAAGRRRLAPLPRPCPRPLS